MTYYRTEKNRPTEKLSLLDHKIIVSLRPIIKEELEAGATAEEILGGIISIVSCEVSSQTLLRTCVERQAEKANKNLGERQ